MNKNALTIGAVAVALITAGTIYAMQPKNTTLEATDDTKSTTWSTRNPNSSSSQSARTLVPAGTMLSMSLQTTLTTKSTNVGDRFEATVLSPVSVGGRVAIPQGATVSGHVILAQQPGKASGRGQLQLSYDKLTFGGNSYDLGMTSQVYESKSGTKKDVALIGGGAVAGGVVGGILGGKDDIAKGAAVGAAAGTGTSLMTRGPQLTLEVGTVLNSSLDESVSVRRS